MLELVNFLVKEFVSEENYEIVVTEDGDDIDIRVQVDKDHVGKIIGRQGRIAKAIRTIVKGAGQRLDQNYSVYIEER